MSRVCGGGYFVPAGPALRRGAPIGAGVCFVRVRLAAGAIGREDGKSSHGMS